MTSWSTDFHRKLAYITLGSFLGLHIHNNLNKKVIYIDLKAGPLYFTPYHTDLMDGWVDGWTD